jgi:hypothetical protein
MRWIYIRDGQSDFWWGRSTNPKKISSMPRTDEKYIEHGKFVKPKGKNQYITKIRKNIARSRCGQKNRALWRRYHPPSPHQKSKGPWPSLKSWYTNTISWRQRVGNFVTFYEHFMLLLYFSIQIESLFAGYFCTSYIVHLILQMTCDFWFLSWIWLVPNYHPTCSFVMIWLYCKLL